MSAKVDWKKFYWKEAEKCSELEQVTATLRVRLAEVEGELAEERAFHGECPGGCGYWKEAAKTRKAERDHQIQMRTDEQLAHTEAERLLLEQIYAAEDRVEKLESLVLRYATAQGDVSHLDREAASILERAALAECEEVKP